MQKDAAMRRALLAWYRREARDLPWRRTRDPYAVWVSEVMLQQTQIPTVIPYYRRFLLAFPTVWRLARAPLERVLERWSGMGYYRRARYLQRAAKQIVRDFACRFPSDYRAARSLPGVGEYTARAVLSIAYNRPYPVLDGNVARVIARLFALRSSLSQRAFRRQAQEELDALLSRRQPGTFNQAMMELGQTVCLPRGPRCDACPVGKWCAARRLGMPESFPQPRPRRAVELRHLAAAVLRPRTEPGVSGGIRAVRGREAEGGRVLLVKGLDEGLMNDLWNFPSAFGRSPISAFARLRRKLGAAVPQPINWTGPLCLVRGQPVLKHGITYRAIQVHLYEGCVEADSLESARWFELAGLDGAAISQLARKIARRIQAGRLGFGRC